PPNSIATNRQEERQNESLVDECKTTSAPNGLPAVPQPNGLGGPEVVLHSSTSDSFCLSSCRFVAMEFGGSNAMSLKCGREAEEYSPAARNATSIVIAEPTCETLPWQGSMD